MNCIYEPCLDMVNRITEILVDILKEEEIRYYNKWLSTPLPYQIMAAYIAESMESKFFIVTKVIGMSFYRRQELCVLIESNSRLKDITSVMFNTAELVRMVPPDVYLSNKVRIGITIHGYLTINTELGKR